MRINNKKGSATVLIGVTFVIFIVGAIYLTMSDPWEKMYGELNSSMDAEHKGTLDKIDNIWTIWPIYIIAAAIIGGIWRLLEQQSDEGFI